MIAAVTTTCITFLLLVSIIPHSQVGLPGLELLYLLCAREGDSSGLPLLDIVIYNRGLCFYIRIQILSRNMIKLGIVN